MKPHVMNPYHTHLALKDGVAVGPGVRVGIPAGTAILSDMNPRAEPGAVVKRDQDVTIDHTLMRNGMQTIRWAGANGYWREVALSDVVVLPSTDTQP